MKREASLFEAIVPIIFLIIILTLNVIYFDDTLGGPNQIALILAATAAGIIAKRLGYRWDAVRAKVVSTIGSAMPSILILLLIGSLAGTWMISGVVPAMIYYGLNIVNPKLFLVTAVLVGSIVSVSTGTTSDTQVLQHFHYDRTNLGVAINAGTLQTSSASLGDIATSSAGLSIGKFPAGGNTINGTIQEVVLYNSDEASNRTCIESDINGYYSIYT